MFLVYAIKEYPFVQYLIDKGDIRPDEASIHPNKNIILRALGVSERVEGDYYRTGKMQISSTNYKGKQISFRVPSWCEKLQVILNGKEIFITMIFLLFVIKNIG